MEVGPCAHPHLGRLTGELNPRWSGVKLWWGLINGGAGTGRLISGAGPHRSQQPLTRPVTWAAAHLRHMHLPIFRCRSLRGIVLGTVSSTSFMHHVNTQRRQNPRNRHSSVEKLSICQKCLQYNTWPPKRRFQSVLSKHHRLECPRKGLGCMLYS
jgi:hypothetical protein